MKIKTFVTFSIFATVLALGACGQQQGGTAQEGATGAKSLQPHETVERSAKALKNNDLKTLLELTLPEEKYAEVKAQWEAKKQEPITDEDKQHYAEMMQMLTQDDAVDSIMTELEPQLDQMRAQMPMFVGMFQGITASAISQNEDMTNEQRQQAQKLVTAVAGWAQKTDLASPDLARDAVTIAVDTAKEVDLPNLEDVRALSFDEMLDKAGVVLAGVKDILTVYNLDVNGALDTVNAETVAQNGDSATVRTKFKFLDTEQVYESDYVMVNDRWIAKEAMEASVKHVADADAGETGE